MIFIVSAFLASATIICLIHAERKYRIKNIELKPNCLLTKHPLVWIHDNSWIKSIFKNEISIGEFLTAHGFDVISVRSRQWELLSRNLSQREEDVHLIVQKQALLRIELNDLNQNPVVKTLQIYDPHSDQKSQLNYAISLAEQDWA